MNIHIVYREKEEDFYCKCKTYKEIETLEEAIQKWRIEFPGTIFMAMYPLNLD